MNLKVKELKVLLSNVLKRRPERADEIRQISLEIEGMDDEEEVVIVTLDSELEQ